MLCLIGRESLYIMALHIFGLFICTWFINLVGLNTNLEMAVSLYTYDVGNNFLLGVLYLLFAITIPLVSIYLFRLGREVLLDIIRVINKNDRKS